MCVLAFAWCAHPRWRLVAIANRDEFHARPSAPLDHWGGGEGIVAGRDLQSGGTWLGVSQGGRFVAVTNLRGYGLPDPRRVSRGLLVSDLLTGEGAYADATSAALGDFNPFNLIVAGGDARFLSNRSHVARMPLAHGIYGISNGPLDEPWPKTMQLKAALLDWIVADGEDLRTLFDALRTETLPDFGAAPADPSDVPLEPISSPIFIRNPAYGTRCSTIVAVDAEGRGMIMERRFDAEGEATGETALGFEWPI